MSETLEPHEAAFLGAKTGYELFGEPLKAYSPSRRVAADAMGVLYPFIGEDGAEQMERTGMYPGILRDTYSVLWLCSIRDADELTKEEAKSGEWTPSRAMERPSDASAEALKWATGMEILNTKHPRFIEALGVFVAIVSAIEAGRFSVVNTAEDGPSDDDSPKV